MIIQRDGKVIELKEDELYMAYNIVRKQIVANDIRQRYYDLKDVEECPYDDKQIEEMVDDIDSMIYTDDFFMTRSTILDEVLCDYDESIEALFN